MVCTDLAGGGMKNSWSTCNRTGTLRLQGKWSDAKTQTDARHDVSGRVAGCVSGYGGIHVSLPLLHAEGNGAVHCICA